MLSNPRVVSIAMVGAALLVSTSSASVYRQTSSSRSDNTAPTVPRTLRVALIKPTSIGVVWAASKDRYGVAGYIVYVGASQKATTAGTSYTIAGLSCANSYSVSVAAFDKTGNRSGLRTIIAPTAQCAVAPAPSSDSQPPTAPGPLTQTSSSANQLSVAWVGSTDDGGVVGYGVTFDGSYAGSAMSTTYTFTGLTCGTSHSVSIDAVDAAGNRSTATTGIVASAPCPLPPPPPPPTAPAAPTGLTVSAVSASGATLAWIPTPGASSYRVYLGSTTQGDTVATTFDLTGLTCGTTYTVGVDARNSTGASTKTTTSLVSQACPVPPPSSDPAPIAGQGYNLAYDEEFANLSGWTNSIWYDPTPATGAVSVSNGDLYLTARKSDGWQEVSATTLGHRAFTKGYFEARLRWTRGNGAWPAFWLMGTPSCTDDTMGQLCPELDVMEAQGSEPTAYSVALHRNTGDKQGVPDSVAPANGAGWKDYGTDLTGWHTYSALWTDSTITWYLDGVKVASAPVYDSTNKPMFLLLDMWTGGWTVGPDATTPAQLVTQVDWVKVWQKP